MTEQVQMRRNLETVLAKEKDLFNFGICHDPLLYSILELLEKEKEKGYQEGYEDGYIDGRQDEYTLNTY